MNTNTPTPRQLSLYAFADQSAESRFAQPARVRAPRRSPAEIAAARVERERARESAKQARAAAKVERQRIQDDRRRAREAARAERQRIQDERRRSRESARFEKGQQILAESAQKDSERLQRKTARVEANSLKSRVEQHTRYHKAMRGVVYRIPAAGEYSRQVRRIIEDAWRRLPERFKPSKVFLQYGWGEEGLFNDRPNPRAPGEDDFENPRYYQGWDAAKQERLEYKDVQLKARYDDHSGTGANKSLYSNPNGPQGNVLTRVDTLADLMDIGRKHIHDRVVLSEHYNSIETEGEQKKLQYPEQFPSEVGNGYRRPNILRLSFTKLRYEPTEELGDKQSWLFKDVLEQNTAKPGDCVFQTMIDQFSQAHRSPLTDSVRQINEKCGIAKGGVSFEGMDKIEQV